MLINTEKPTAKVNFPFTSIASSLKHTIAKIGFLDHI
jgi:hypothetical protein